MADIIYRIVEHNGGWAYKVGEVFSETFPSRDEALAAAQAAAEEQERPGADEAIEYQDEDGRWREEEAPGFDRPHTAVEDEPEG